VARRHDIRFLGPNCMGIIDTAAKTVFSFAFSWQSAFPMLYVGFLRGFHHKGTKTPAKQPVRLVGPV